MVRAMKYTTSFTLQSSAWRPSLHIDRVAKTHPCAVCRARLEGPTGILKIEGNIAWELLPLELLAAPSLPFSTVQVPVGQYRESLYCRDLISDSHTVINSEFPGPRGNQLLSFERSFALAQAARLNCTSTAFPNTHFYRSQRRIIVVVES